MMKSSPSRWQKGALVSAAAAAFCYWLWVSLHEWAGQARSDGTFSGLFESLFAGITGVVSMPVLLWAGMRVLQERGNHLLVVLGAIAWFFIGGHLVDEHVSTTGTVVFLTLFTAFGTLLSGVEAPRR
ncbi:hypothetical protein AB0E27_11175 [Streptomyces sparsogenes]|uniref:hypothetical protein n=1 Tax=Streptomyces sparsogenes TaxID=67365 RepID=UPI0033C9B60B